MKKILWMLLLLVNFQWVSAQEAQALINEFKTQKSAEYMNVSHAMMGIAALKVKNDNVNALLKQIKTMKILELSECDKNVRKKFIEKAQKLTRRVNQQVQNYKTCLKNSHLGVEKFNFSLGLSFSFFCIDIILLSV